MKHMKQTKVLKVDFNDPDAASIHEAADAIRAGRLVAFPTETVYGLGANALDGDAIQQIYHAKRRPANDPIIAHLGHAAQLDYIAVDIPEAARQLAEVFWPGPLTMVLRRAAHIPANIAVGLTTIAARVPVHPVARALLEASGVPIAAPSANTFTRPSATTAAHVLEDLDGYVDIVLDSGPTHIGLESTVLDLTQFPPLVLRPGGVLIDDLRQIIPEVEVKPQYLTENQTASVSPGMLIKHYSPKARVILYEGLPEAVTQRMCATARELVADGKRAGVLVSEEEAPQFTDLGVRIIALGKQDDLAQVARVLFAAMRALDAQGVDAILVHGFGQDGLGAAIWDRLVRAAEGRVVRV